MCAKTACVYHSVDLDGWMSAAIIKKWWNEPYNQAIHEKQKDTIDFIGYNYGDPIPDLSLHDRVIMCDISFPRQEMYVLWERLGRNFIWIDHHISAINEVKDIPDNTSPDRYRIEGLRNVNYSACELVWMYIYNGIRMDSESMAPKNVNPMPEIVRLLGRYDCFGHKGTHEEKEVLEFQYGARQCIHNYEKAYEMLCKSILDTHKGHPLQLEDAIHMKGIAIYNYLCMEAQQAYKNGSEEMLYWAEDKGTGVPKQCSAKFICINKERFNPINFGIDYHADGYDGVASFHRRNDGKWAFSLYNDNGLVDCSQIAKLFGGGGHKGASGMILNNEQFLSLIK